MRWLVEWYDARIDALVQGMRLRQPSTVNYPPGQVEEFALYVALFLIGLMLLAYLGAALWKTFETPSGTPRKRRWFWAPVQAMAVAVGLLLLLEMAIRGYVATQAMPTYIPHPLYLWRFRPNTDVTVQTPVDVMRFRTNSMGLRDYEIPLEKESGEFRIVCLGDSASFGQSVPLEKTYHKVLQAMLEEQYPGRKFTVINGGMQGYSILQGFWFYCDVGTRYSPDLVVVNEFNEFSDRQMGDFVGNVPTDALARRTKELLWSSMLYLTMRKATTRVVQGAMPKPMDPSDSTKQIIPVEETTHFIKQFIGRFRQDHTRAIFALWRRPAAWRQVYEKLLKDVSREEGIVYADYHYQLIKRNPAKFWLKNDPTHHPSADGHAMIARELFNTIILHRLVDPVPGEK